MQVTLDLSPILVNRTAVHDICLEVDAIARRQPAARVDYQFVGRHFGAQPSAGDQRRLRERFFRELAAPERLIAASARAAGEASAARTFYLDPLYTLFGTLGPDDIVMCYDLSPVTHPHWHGASVGPLYDAAFSRIARSGCTVIAVSENTADSFRANYGGGAKPVRTVYLYLPNAVARGRSDFPCQGLPASSPYFLFVGSLEARKNITGAMQAFRLSGLAAKGYRLLVVGARAHGAEMIERHASEIEGVVLCGFLSQAEKLAAYAGATGFVYPSYLEGFGVPLLEAMAFGIPAVTTVTGASPEIGGPDVPCLDPDDHHGIAAAMRFIAGLTARARARLGNRLRKRAEERFSFAHFARNIEEVLFA